MARGAVVESQTTDSISCSAIVVIFQCQLQIYVPLARFCVSGRTIHFSATALPLVERGNHRVMLFLVPYTGELATRHRGFFSVGKPVLPCNTSIPNPVAGPRVWPTLWHRGTSSRVPRC